MNVHLQLYRCLTPFHQGAGEGGGRIDRPLLRDSWKGEPYLLSSSIRGKGRVYGKGKVGVEAAFGPDWKSDGSATDPGRHGSVVWSDARLLFLPISSRFGTTAHLASRISLARLGDWADWAGWPELGEAVRSLLSCSFPILGARQVVGCYRPPQEGNGGEWLVRKLKVPGSDPARFHFEDLGSVRAISLDRQMGAKLYAVARMLSEVLFPERERERWESGVLLAGDDFYAQAMQSCSLVEPATAISDRGTAMDGTLRFTEYLPAGSIFAGVVFADDTSANTLRKSLSRGVWALGADITGGKGLMDLAGRGE